MSLDLHDLAEEIGEAFPDWKVRKSVQFTGSNCLTIETPGADNPYFDISITIDDPYCFYPGSPPVSRFVFIQADTGVGYGFKDFPKLKEAIRLAKHWKTWTPDTWGFAYFVKVSHDEFKVNFREILTKVFQKSRIPRDKFNEVDDLLTDWIKSQDD